MTGACVLAQFHQKEMHLEYSQTCSLCESLLGVENGEIDPKTSLKEITNVAPSMKQMSQRSFRQLFDMN